MTSWLPTFLVYSLSWKWEIRSTSWNLSRLSYHPSFVDEAILLMPCVTKMREALVLSFHFRTT